MLGTKDSRISKEFVLISLGNNSVTTQILIFEKYLGINSITELIYNKTIFCNPLRLDAFPTCTFKIFTGVHGDKVWFRDWADNTGYDCFDLVQHIGKCNFNEALELICFHFSLLSAERTTELQYVLTPASIKELIIKQSTKIDIKIKLSSWTDNHKNYWRQYGLSGEDLQDVFPIKCYWINNNRFQVPKDIGFAYSFGESDYKLYLPFADKTKNELRFIHNNGNLLQGEKDLKFDKKILIITSSYKDVKVLRKLERIANLGFEVIAPMSETSWPKEKINLLLKNKKYEYIILYYDNDKAGIDSATKQANENNLLFMYNPIEKAKDISDYRKQLGEKETIKLITKLLYENIPPF